MNIFVLKRVIRGDTVIVAVCLTRLRAATLWPWTCQSAKTTSATASANSCWRSAWAWPSLASTGPSSIPSAGAHSCNRKPGEGVAPAHSDLWPITPDPKPLQVRALRPPGDQRHDPAVAVRGNDDHQLQHSAALGLLLHPAALHHDHQQVTNESLSHWLPDSLILWLIVCFAI